jgi:uncharacterized C2H2 Zn-finger protein
MNYYRHFNMNQTRSILIMRCPRSDTLFRPLVGYSRCGRGHFGSLSSRGINHYYTSFGGKLKRTDRPTRVIVPKRVGVQGENYGADYSRRSL